MAMQNTWWSRHLLSVILVSVTFVVTVSGGAAAKVSTNLTVAQTVRNHQQQCSDLGGTFTTGGWTTPGDKPGTKVSTTFTTCDFGGGDSTTCYHTPGSVDCRVTVSAPPEGRDEAASQDDAMADDPFGPAPDVTIADSVDEPDDSHSG